MIATHFHDRYFYIGLYSSGGTVRPMGHGQLGPRADAPAGKDTPENY